MFIKNKTRNKNKKLQSNFYVFDYATNLISITKTIKYFVKKKIYKTKPKTKQKLHNVIFMYSTSLSNRPRPILPKLSL